jgi:hypothetical protein
LWPMRSTDNWRALTRSALALRGLRQRGLRSRALCRSHRGDKAQNTPV